MPVWLSDNDYAAVEAACDALLPGDATTACAVDYIDCLLGAFSFDPPRIWAGGPFSGRRGGDPGFARFHHLTALDELAWRTRIEGSLGDPAREFNGPVVGLQEKYRAGLDVLGDDFATLPRPQRVARLKDNPEFSDILFAHACEGTYGAPEYGGNRDLAGWRSIGFDGDVQPLGYTDDEVSSP